MKAGFKKALLIADPQNDFCPDGALAVPAGDTIIPNINRYIRFFSRKNMPVFVTRDWHPRKTGHFKKFGGAWPEHCIQGTRGARFHPDLKIPGNAFIMSKGMDPAKDSYTAFESFYRGKIPLEDLLKKLEIRELYVGGLATDYCVKATVFDALKGGYKVRILLDAVKGVDVKRGDSLKAVRKMISRGAKKMTLSQLK